MRIFVTYIYIHKLDDKYICKMYAAFNIYATYIEINMAE